MTNCRERSSRKATVPVRSLPSNSAEPLAEKLAKGIIKLDVYSIFLYNPSSLLYDPRMLQNATKKRLRNGGTFILLDSNQDGPSGSTNRWSDDDDLSETSMSPSVEVGPSQNRSNSPNSGNRGNSSPSAGSGGVTAKRPRGRPPKKGRGVGRPPKSRNALI